jgi:hypothetical protein
MRMAPAAPGGVNRRACVALLAWLLVIPPAALGADALPAVNAKPVPLGDNVSVGDRVARIRFLGMLSIPSLTVNGVRLSQLSDLAWDEDAAILYAVSDKGALFHLHPVFRDGALVDVKLSRAVPLRDLKTGLPLRYKRADSEGIALLHHNNGHKHDTQLLISFERFPRVVRYRPDGYAIAEHPLPMPLDNAKIYRDENRMLEAICHDSRYGILTMPEEPLKQEAPGYNRIYSFNGKSWRYPLSDQNRVVSLACMGNGEVLVLESDFGLHFWRAEVTLKRTRLTDSAAADTPLEVQTLFTLAAAEGYQIDNFEGIAHHRGKRYFMVSDDNDFFLQRTLLMYFELLDE